jgi:putative (di)nucleoside polyphosphate hydrolase
LIDTKLYRAGIVAVVTRADGKVLFCQRADYSDSWQFPQGGIEEGESAEQALYRELLEELGNNKCRLLRRAPRPTLYRWPPHKKPKKSGPHAATRVGQAMTWFLCEYEPGQTPDLAHSDGTFTDWKWVDPEEALNGIVEWKRESFREGMAMLLSKT